MHIRPFDNQTDREAVIALWNRAGLVRPWNDPGNDIDRKLNVQPELFLVGVVGGQIMGALMAGFDGHRGWINYLAIEPVAQGNGHGRALMAVAEDKLRAMGCPKINLQIRAGNTAIIDFYQALGFQEDAVVSMGKRLIPDN